MGYQINEVNIEISLTWPERELFHSTSLSLALGRPRPYLLPTLEESEY